MHISRQAIFGFVVAGFEMVRKLPSNIFLPLYALVFLLNIVNN